MQYLDAVHPTSLARLYTFSIYLHISIVQEFEEALCVLIELASKPYVRLKANHELYEEGKEALQAMVRCPFIVKHTSTA